MLTVLPLETTIIYGPLFSRRLGRSLGVNLLPFDRKVCSFDCVYCHYGRTTVHIAIRRESGAVEARGERDLEIAATAECNASTMDTREKRDLEIAAAECNASTMDTREKRDLEIAATAERHVDGKGTFPGVEEVLRAVEAALRRYPHVDALTFSGNGEPTLHPHFPAIVAEVRRLRDVIAPNVKLALFSNATTAYLPHIQAALAHFDLPVLKLDAGDPVTLARINRPAPGVTLDTILEGLKATPNLIVQSVLIDGDVSNVTGKAFEAWAVALEAVRPSTVQIYSTDYPAPDAGVARVLPYVLKRIAGEVTERTGVRVEAFWY